ncbi:MAG: SRPBCC domain-containing protein [Pseudomonadota bacterium]
MVWTIVKWVVIPLLILVAALAYTGRKTFHVEIIISAPPEQVWAVLMDTASYGEWNPVFTKVEGDHQLGGSVKNTVVDPKGNVLNIEAGVDVLDTNRELRQSGGYWGFLTFKHQWLLEPVERGTKVIQHEVDQGFYMWFWDSSWIEPSYTKVNKALKERVMASSN